MAKTEPAARVFTALGAGVTYAIEGDKMFLEVDLSAARATPSASGKMRLCGNTGGWQNIPGADPLRANVMIGRKA